jgi:predicted ArsR family transcriptional regulator
VERETNDLFFLTKYLYKVGNCYWGASTLQRKIFIKKETKPAYAGEESKTRRRIVKLLKIEGSLDSATLAERIGVSTMAIRQHLYILQDQKMVMAKERPVPVGRPAKYWELTRQSDRLFPDAYAKLSVSLIDSLNDAFGAEGLQRILERRTARQRASYSARISSSIPLRKKLEKLAEIRSEEGYMAEVRSENTGQYLFIENHCPICAAASSCKGLCANELALFRSILGPDALVERVEHILAGERRCAYRMKNRLTRKSTL